MKMTYHNPGSRPLIVAIDHDMKAYTSLAPGTMKLLKSPVSVSLLAPSVKPMKHLPPDMNPDNPVEPENDVFRIVPPQSDITLPDLEEVTLPIYVRYQLKKYPDVRGKRSTFAEAQAPAYRPGA